LAARLSENPDVCVALIEAGEADSADEIHTPAAFSQLFKSDFDWDLSSEPEEALDGRRLYLPRGRGLGGCSSINAMIYIRGNPLDYDEWAAQGAAGWSWTDVLPYFRRSEDNERGASAYHGTGGPLSVSDSRSNHRLAEAFVEAAEQAGHPRNADFNGAQQDGFGRYQLTQCAGMRCSAAVAFLLPAADRPNLHVMTGVRAARVIIDNRRAVGVEVHRHGHVETVTADAEIVLCAGSYHTPQLLMLSGIGPADELAQLGIPVIEDLSVGDGLQDHPMVLLNYLTDAESLMTAGTLANVELLTAEGRGPLTSNIGEAGGFVRTRAELDAPDVQFHAAPVLFYEEGLGALTDHGYAFGPCVVKPTSRGRVKLRNARPDAKPRIEHRHLSTEADRRSMIAGLRLALELAGQPALKAVCRTEFVVPDADDDAALLAFARRTTQTLYHPTSSCAIGRVVAPDLRVLGVDGLRVADASVMPSIVRGNTNAAAIMIGERAADLLRAPDH
jgi:choline dehydrogenase-like flavoprotein